MIRSCRSMLGLGAALAAAATLTARVGPEVVATPEPDPSLLPPSERRPRRPSGVRGSSGPRVLGPPETADQLLAVMNADLKRERRLERNRRANGSDTA